MKVAFLLSWAVFLTLLTGCAASSKQNTVHDTTASTSVVSAILKQQADTKSLKERL